MRLKTIILISFLVLILLVFVQNMDRVELRFLFWQFSFSRMAILFSVFLLGVVVGWTAGKRPKNMR